MYLQVSQLSKSYSGNALLKNCSFDVEQGITLAVLGKSGCGKTTLLKLLAGIETLDAGQIFCDGVDMTNTATAKRGIVYLFQEALLFPHLNVYDNIAFGLRLRKESLQLLDVKVRKCLSDLQLTGHEYKMPHELSGGQKQRVAFGRAYIIQPKVLLLDEPFAALDSETRQDMQNLFKQIVQKENISSIFVTHDVKEALTIGDKMAYLSDGNLKIYNAKTEFIDDERTGVSREFNFWKNIKEK